MFGFDDLLTVGGGLLGGLFGGDEEAGQTTTTQEPWGPQQQYLLDLFAKAQAASATGDQMNPDQIAAQGELGKWASGENYNPFLGSGYTSHQGSVINQLQNFAAGANPNRYSGMDNPYLQKSIDSASQDAMRNLAPMINRANAASGSFGNSGVAETYGRAASDSLGNIANNARMGEYTRQQQLHEAALNRQLAALGPLMGTANAQASQQANLFESDANRRISALQPFFGQASYEQGLPWANVKNYGQTIQGSYGGSNSTPYFTNTAGNVLGGAGLGTWLGNQIGKKPATPVMGEWDNTFGDY